MEEMNKLTGMVVRRAKALVLANSETPEQDRVIESLTILRAVKSLGGDAENVLRRILKVKGCIRWPYQLADQLLQDVEKDVEELEAEAEEEKLALGLGFKQAFNAAKRQDSCVQLSSLLGEILNQPQEPLIKELCRLNGYNPKGTGRSVIAGWQDLTEKVSRFHEILRKEMPGQPAAVDMLVNEYRLRSQFPSSTGPRGVLTVLGPHESDKVGVGRALTNALSYAENAQYIFCDAEHEGTSSLSEGTPCGVLLFNRVEKAGNKLSDIAHQVEKGEFQGINLRNSWVVFSSELGTSFFDSIDECGVLQGTSHLKGELIDILERERIPHPMIDEKDRMRIFPAEMISLMRKGGAVVLSHLNSTGYISLMNRCLDEAVESKHTFMHGINLENDSRLVLLLNTLPRLGPNQVRSATQGFLDHVSNEALARYNNELKEKDEVVLDIRLASDSKRFLDERMGNRAMRILILDDDSRMETFIQSDFSEWDLDLKRCEDLKEVVDFRPDMIMLDLDISDDRDNLTALALHGKIKSELPGMPIFLFSEVASIRKRFFEIVQQGGARGFFEFDSQPSKSVEVSSREISEFRDLLRNFRFDNCLERLLLQNRRIAFATEYRLAGNSNHCGTVEVTLHSLQEQAVIGDVSGPIRAVNDPGVTLADVYGLERAKKRLRQAIQLIQHPRELQSMGVRPPSGYLLDGPPGTGKTFLARALAGEVQMPFFQLSAGELASKYYGESEERIRDLFNDARKHAPSIIFIDEIDAIARMRGSETRSHEDKLLNQLLSCMDGFSKNNRFVFVLASTNRADVLDSAIRRPGRFDETIPIDLPGKEGRREMLLKRLPNLFEDLLDDNLAGLVTRTAGMSPATIDRVIRESAYYAAARGDNVHTIDDLTRACSLVKFGAEKEDIELAPDDKKRTAWHEAGHALVKHLLFPSQTIDYVSIIPTEEGALGFVSTNVDEKEHTRSRSALVNQIAVCMAGREAEMMVPDLSSEESVNTGAVSDLGMATQIALLAVTEYGMDSEFGDICLKSLPENVALSMGEKARAGIQQFLGEGKSIARTTLRKNKVSLETIAHRLMKSGSLDGAVIPNLLETKPDETEEVPVLFDDNVPSSQQKEDNDPHNGEPIKPSIRVEKEDA